MNLLRVEYSLTETRWTQLAAMAVARVGAADVPVPGAGWRAGSPRRCQRRSALAFHPRTLAQVLFLRATLHADDPTDRFLIGAMIGILHGRSPTYLSDIMPNTFSMRLAMFATSWPARVSWRLSATPSPASTPSSVGFCARVFRPSEASHCWATRATPARGRDRPCASVPCPTALDWW